MDSFAVTTQGCRSSSAQEMPGTAEIVTPIASDLITWLIDNLIVLPEEWDELSARERDEISALESRDLALGKLVQRHLLTPSRSRP